MTQSSNNSSALQFEIVGHKFVERTTGERGGGRWGEPRIYVFLKDEGVLEQLVERHSRPYNVWKKQIVPAALELLREHMLTRPTACYSWAEGDAPKARWSQRAGCSCPCSPGFIVKTTHDHDLYLDVDVKRQQWGDVTEKVRAEIADETAEATDAPDTDSASIVKRHDLTLETEDGHFEGRGRIFRVAGSENRAGYGIGGWDQTGEGRLVVQGPMVTGPVAYLFGLAGVIDTNGGTGKAHADAVAEGRMFDATAGDVVTINGIEFALTVDARGYPHLDHVAADEPVDADAEVEAAYDAHLDAWDGDSDYRAATERAASQFGVPTADPKIVRFRA